MKKLTMIFAALAMTLAMQAQTKFHDVEANEAQGKVKSGVQDERSGPGGYCEVCLGERKAYQPDNKRDGTRDKADLGLRREGTGEGSEDEHDGTGR